jgi:hypothetical protein
LTTSFPKSFDPVDAGLTLNLDPGGLTVFISYAWADAKKVLEIDKCLRLKGLHTKIDRRDFFAGSRVRDEIFGVMQTCDVILIFYSAQAKDRTWTKKEREMAQDLEIEADKEGRTPPRIVFVVTDDTPLPGPTERNRIAILAKGKSIKDVCDDPYLTILRITRGNGPAGPTDWDEVF